MMRILYVEDDLSSRNVFADGVFRCVEACELEGAFKNLKGDL
jgi:hypothetical protein